MLLLLAIFAAGKFVSGLSLPTSCSRRSILASSIAAGSILCPQQGTAVPSSILSTTPFTEERDAGRDSAFAKTMSNGMKSYESAIAPKKTQLFDRLVRSLPSGSAVVVELGIGTFPNAPYYAMRDVGGEQRQLDIIGVDPNASMERYARDAAANFGLDSVRVVQGVGEAIPLVDGCADAVVCTLTLCSVKNPSAVLAEIRRVLKPGGKFLFVEHELSPTNQGLASLQRTLSPLQVISADGCHLDRSTLDTIRHAEFTQVDAEQFELPGFLYLSSTAAGIATK